MLSINDENGKKIKTIFIYKILIIPQECGYEIAGSMKNTATDYNTIYVCIFSLLFSAKIFELRSVCNSAKRKFAAFFNQNQKILDSFEILIA